MSYPLPGQAAVRGGDQCEVAGCEENEGGERSGSPLAVCRVGREGKWDEWVNSMLSE